MKNISRRQMLTAATGLTVGGGLLAIHGSRGQAGQTTEGTGQGQVFIAETPAFGDMDKIAHYTPISPQEAAERAYTVYPEGACMYATMRSVVSMVAEKHGLTISPVFYNLFQYGHGGCGGMGTLCGACNGAAAVMGLFCSDKKVRDAMITQLFRWYESTKLPKYVPQSAKQAKPIPTAVAGSVLCHISTSKWAKIAKVDVFSPERKQRCRRLTADVARKTVEILNAQYKTDAEKLNGKKADQAAPLSPRQMTPPDSCIACHSTPGGEPGSYVAEATKTVTKMDCSSCHAMPQGHPKTNGHLFPK